ncbi:MAG: hypothetical protein APF84_00300 [Gracilibacter sp. BRH_c7a]|nr:MAG: hypothetical protein APF84_00300 [Gracilibacter sp. BRH_c7a]
MKFNSYNYGEFKGATSCRTLASGGLTHPITACYQNLREYESSNQTSVTREPFYEMGGNRLAHPCANLVGEAGVLIMAIG